MADITVNPQVFQLVEYDAAEITALADEVATTVGLAADVSITVNIDEAVIVAKFSSHLEGAAAVVDVSGGALESLRKARQFDPTRARNALGQTLMRVRDRLDPAFGDPPSDDEMTVLEESAWSTYIEGRLDRLGVLTGRPQRRIYHFRVRHGFSDTVDRTFDRLWNAEGLTWADIQAASAEAASSAVPA